MPHTNHVIHVVIAQQRSSAMGRSGLPKKKKKKKRKKERKKERKKKKTTGEEKTGKEEDELFDAVTPRVVCSTTRLFKKNKTSTSGSRTCHPFTALPYSSPYLAWQQLIAVLTDHKSHGGCGLCNFPGRHAVLALRCLYSAN
mgnify:CR=1 FL=1